MSVSPTAVVGVAIGGALHHAWRVASEWWTPRATCPAGLAELTAEISTARETTAERDFVSQLAACLAVGAVVAASLLAVWACDSVRAHQPLACVGNASSALPHVAAPVPLTAAVAASPVVAAEPQRFNLALDEELDALEQNETALCSYVPRRRRKVCRRRSFGTLLMPARCG